MNCSHCHKELPAGHALPFCPYCGCTVELGKAPGPAPAFSASRKQIALLVFWVALLSGPILAILFARTGNGPGALLFPVISAIVSGFALAKAYARTVLGSIVAGVLLSFGVLLAYVGLVFVGCVAIMNR
jgi:hypothetical protein